MTAELPFFELRHRELAARFKSWVEVNLGAFESSEGGDGQDAARILALLARDGWMSHALPLCCGQSGAGVDIRAVCLMREILGFSSAMADVAFSEPWLAGLPVLLYGTAAQIDSVVGSLAQGRCLPAFALSEPEAGSDVASIRCTATATAAGWTINGRKTWTSNAGLADHYVVFARTSLSSGTDGLSAFVVEGKNPGVRLLQRVKVLPPHTVGTLEFSNCAVGHDSLLGEEGQGFRIAMNVLELFRPTVGAATVGFARRALDVAVEQCQRRVAFKKPIAEHQIIQAKLADMSLAVELSALCVYRAAWSADTDAPTRGRDAAMAKLFATEAAQRVIDEAVQVFGGMGVVSGAIVERLYRHVRAFRIFDGTSEIQRLLIAKHLLQAAGR